MQASSISFTPAQFLADPSTYRGVTALTSSIPGCLLDQPGFVCCYSIILGDNESVPIQPNLKNSDGGNNDIGKSLVWPRSTKKHFMTFI